jgi:hypothetical protein
MECQLVFIEAETGRNLVYQLPTIPATGGVLIVSSCEVTLVESRCPGQLMYNSCYALAPGRKEDSEDYE